MGEEEEDEEEEEEDDDDEEGEDEDEEEDEEDFLIVGQRQALTPNVDERRRARGGTEQAGEGRKPRTQTEAEQGARPKQTGPNTSRPIDPTNQFGTTLSS